MNIVPQEYWDAYYKNFEFDIAPSNDEVRKWIERFIKKGKGKCLEIGCFPGRYLAVFGELGYELNGIDLTPRVEKDLPNWLKNRFYNIGEFHKSNFENYESKLKFDIVSSFGFIEHFNNWEDILIKHSSLVNKNGYLVVSVPNFKGTIQRLLHFILDRQNYKRHNIKAMDINKWRKLIASLGFDIIYCGAFGIFDFWAEEQQRNALLTFLLKCVIRLTPTFNKRLRNDELYSPYYGIIAHKIDNLP